MRTIFCGLFGLLMLVSITSFGQWSENTRGVFYTAPNRGVSIGLPPGIDDKLFVYTTQKRNTLKLLSLFRTSGAKYGVHNTITGGNLQYGIYNRVTNTTATSVQTGIYNYVEGGTGTSFGSRNYVNARGGATAYGTYSNVRDSKTGGSTFGLRSTVNGISSGSIQYAVYAQILGNSTGQRFGIYSSVPADAWAGYFLGKSYFRNNVGIGTRSPGVYMLGVKGDVGVDGKIHTNELEVKNTALPDYVFEEDYNLRSLQEVESYIKAHKHLPEVPSAKEVAENGMNVMEMNNALLKKVEELTLYILEQNKRICLLEDRLNQ